MFILFRVSALPRSAVADPPSQHFARCARYDVLRAHMRYSSTVHCPDPPTQIRLCNMLLAALDMTFCERICAASPPSPRWRWRSSSTVAPSYCSSSSHPSRPRSGDTPGTAMHPGTSDRQGGGRLVVATFSLCARRGTHAVMSGEVPDRARPWVHRRAAAAARNLTPSPTCIGVL